MMKNILGVQECFFFFGGSELKKKKNGTNWLTLNSLRALLVLKGPRIVACQSCFLKNRSLATNNIEQKLGLSNNMSLNCNCIYNYCSCNCICSY